MSHLVVERLTAGYGGAAALDGLDLSIARGELFVLLGSSGSGKTTLLRVLAGFLRPASGRVVLGGRDMTALPPHRRPVNTMFQSYALFPHMSVADNVGFGLRRQGVPRAEARTRVAEMLDLVRMTPYADRRPDDLSGGQRQRVALARSLAPRPDLLLLDEPLSALDRGLRERTRAELTALHRRLGTTFVLVTHDQDEALQMATRIGVLHQGRLAQAGAPADIYEQPASRAVAEFMGIANILPAVLRGPDGPGARIDLGPLGTVHTAARPTGAAGAAVHLALRPERLRLAAGDGEGPNRLRGTVRESAYRGDAVLHAVQLPDGQMVRVAQPLTDGVGGGTHGPGDRVTVSFQPEACIVLMD